MYLQPVQKPLYPTEEPYLHWVGMALSYFAFAFAISLTISLFALTIYYVVPFIRRKITWQLMKKCWSILGLERRFRIQSGNRMTGNRWLRINGWKSRKTATVFEQIKWEEFKDYSQLLQEQEEKARINNKDKMNCWMEYI